MSLSKEVFGKFVEEWCYDKYYRDYDFCIGLSYREKITSINKVKSDVKYLFSRINKKLVIDGVYVIEDKFEEGLHVHGLLICNGNENELGKLLKDYWYKENGIYWIDKFITGKGYDYYMSKDYDKKVFDFGFLDEFLY